MDQSLPLPVKIFIGAIIVVIALVILAALSPIARVNAGERGLIRTWGAVENRVLDPGIHWRWPFVQKVETYTAQPIELTYKVEVGEHGALTKDNQTVGSTMVLFYKYDIGRLVEMRNDWGEQPLRSKTQAALIEAFKESIGVYDIFNVAMNREKIREEAWGRFTSKVDGYPINVTELRISNYDWSQEFENQIETTMQRAQQVKQAEQDLLLTEQKAQKQVKEAEAQKAALVTKAEGEKEAAALMAEAKALEGEGIRQYNNSVQANMDLEVKIRELEIRKLEMEQWDGKYVPNNMYGPIPVDTVGGLNRN